MRSSLPKTFPLALSGCVALGLAASACGSSGGFVFDAETFDATADGGNQPADGGPDAGVDAGPQPDTGPRPDMGPRPDGGNPMRPTFAEVPIDSTIIHGQGIEVVDIDGDGDTDVLSALSLTDAVHLYINDGSGNFTAVVVGSGIVAMETAVADFDGDGDNDIAAVGLFERSGGFTSPGEVVWYENPGNVSGNWIRHDITGFTFWGGLYIEAGDITGDGRADLVVGAIQLADTNGNPQGNGLHWFRNTGGAFAGPTAVEAGLLEVTALAVADVDGSGVVDIIALGSNSNEVAWWDNGRASGATDNNPSFTKHIIGTPTQPYDLHFVNMDADPARELLVSSGDNGGSVVYFDPGATLSNPWNSVPVASGLGGPLSSRVFGGDFDGDGAIDVATGFWEAASIGVYYRNGAQFEGVAVRNGYTNLNWLIAADLNGDQRLDLLTATYDPGGAADSIAWWRSE